MIRTPYRVRTIIFSAAYISGLLLFGCEPASVSTTTDDLSLPAPQSLPVNSVEVLRARIVPFRTASGVRLKTVLVDWKNVGARPIRAVDANIILFDGRGRLEGGPRDYAIYAVSDESPGIAPGEVYQEPEDRGHILDGELARARRARVEITEVLETGAY